MGPIDRAKVASRIKIICDQRYDGDPERLARDASIGSKTLRDILRDRQVSGESFDTVVRRVGSMSNINGDWLRHGTGHPYKVSGLAGGLERTEPTTSPVLDPAPAPAPAPAKHAHQAAPSSLDLLTEIAQRIASFDKRLTAVEESGPVLAKLNERQQTLQAEHEALSREVQANIKRFGSVMESGFTRFAQQIQEQGGAIEELSRKVERVTTGLGDLIAEVETLQETVTAPPEPEFNRPADESSYPPDAVFSLREWLALPGDRPLKVLSFGVSHDTMTSHLAFLCRLDGIEPGPNKTSKKAFAFQAHYFRTLLRFYENHGANGGRDSTRDLALFALDRTPRPAKNGTAAKSAN